jgi:predicted amino acid dehydrogenase
VEPSAFVDDAAIERLRQGLVAFSEKLRDGDAASLLAHLVRQEELLPDEPEDTITSLSMSIEEPRPGASRVAFLIHFVFPERELSMGDPSLRHLPPAARRALAARMMEVMELKPTLVFARNLFDGRVWFATILIPADVAQLETLHRMDYRFLETERLQEAVDLAAGLGCTCVALGGYTSIIARDGEAVLPPEGVRITSGNTFTVVVGARRIAEACAAAGIDPTDPESRVGVVGATGNIGSSLLRRLLAGPRGFSRALMVGRKAEHLERLRRELDDGRVELQATTDLAELRSCNVVAIATNTNEPLIYPEHLRHDRPIVIADVSVPSAVSRQVRGLGHVRVVPLAGTVAVPGAPELRLSSHTPPGTAFCCAAEAMLIGLEPEATAQLRLTGPIDPRSTEVLDQLGEKHGLFTAFGKGGFKRG